MKAYAMLYDGLVPYSWMPQRFLTEEFVGWSQLPNGTFNTALLWSYVWHELGMVYQVSYELTMTLLHQRLRTRWTDCMGRYVYGD